MTQVVEGTTDIAGASIGIVASRFTQDITEELLACAVEQLIVRGIRDEDIFVYWVPGAFEIPILLGKLATHDTHEAYITLGAVIRGETSHYDYICGETAHGIAAIARKYTIPVSFGVLTCDTYEQAKVRSAKDENIFVTDALDRKILSSLAKNHPHPTGIKTIAAAVSETEDTLEEVYEPYLIRQGYLVKTARGRLLSTEGMKLYNVEDSGTVQQQLFND